MRLDDHWYNVTRDLGSPVLLRVAQEHTHTISNNHSIDSISHRSKVYGTCPVSVCMCVHKYKTHKYPSPLSGHTYLHKSRVQLLYLSNGQPLLSGGRETLPGPRDLVHQWVLSRLPELPCILPHTCPISIHTRTYTHTNNHTDKIHKHTTPYTQK